MTFEQVVADGTLKKIRNRWLVEYLENGTLKKLVRNYWSVGLAASAALLTVIVLVWAGFQRGTQKKLRIAAETDALTGLMNKRAFYRTVEEIVRKNRDKNYVLIRFDIDRFKVVNEHFGMEEGDRLIKKLGDVIREIWDKSPRVIAACRLDADHFAVCREGMDVDAASICSQITDKLRELSKDYDLNMSSGFCGMDDSGLDVGAYSDRAMLAIRSIKGNYSRKYAWYTDEMRRQMEKETELELLMNKALAAGQFVP